MMRIIQYIFVFLIISLMGSMSVQASDAIDTAQIAISLEKINLKVKNLEISVQSIILEYEALGDEKKVMRRVV